MSLRLAIETATSGREVPGEQLEAAFGEIFDIVEATEIRGSDRILYMLERRVDGN